jgi:predicted RNA-binding protein with EMAP domain
MVRAKVNLIAFGLCAMSLIGCGDSSKARMEVAKDKILSQVDALLGEVDVKRKTVDLAVQRLGDGIDKLKKGKIEARVRANSAGEQIAAVEQKIGEADKALGRLRDHLKEEKEVELSGRTFTPTQLKDMADKAISARKALATQVELLRQSRSRLDAVATNLENREKESLRKVSVLKLQLSEIDDKVIALKAIKDATTLSGNEPSVDFASVEESIRSLSTKVDAELAFQDEKWKESEQENESTNLDAIISQTSTTGDTLAEIEKMIGK